MSEPQSKQDISLIFLDVDGVLNVTGYKSSLHISRSHVERLSDIIKSSNVECKICISSAWRLHKYALQLLRQRLMKMGNIDIENVIIGQTESIPFDDNIQNLSAQRISEIRSYLERNEELKSKYNIVSFCVIDDLDLSKIGIHNFVHVNGRNGLTVSNAQEVLCILNRDRTTQKMMTLKTKPCIKLLFIAAIQHNSSRNNIKMLHIIQKKTECTLVVAMQDRNYFDDALTIQNFSEITQYVTNLEREYNIQSWAVLDYMNILQKYRDQTAWITRKFIKVDPMEDLSINDVLAVLSILNKWS